jgi:hypothetical protein
MKCVPEFTLQAFFNGKSKEKAFPELFCGPCEAVTSSENDVKEALNPAVHDIGNTILL